MKPAPFDYHAPTTIEDARFAHESEEEFARLLDFYGVRWEYEPRTFPLRRGDDGRIHEAFAPDFYLADLDPTRGGEIAKTRPVVVVSLDAMNRHPE